MGICGMGVGNVVGEVVGDVVGDGGDVGVCRDGLLILTVGNGVGVGVNSG